MLFWEKKEEVERGRGALGGDEMRTGREKPPHTPLFLLSICRRE